MSAAEKRTSVPLAPLTSIRIGGRAREFHVPASLEELRAVLSALDDPPFILGGGTNTLFPDGEFTRPVVSVQRLDRIEVRGERILAQCGARLPRLVQVALREGLSGLEGMVGIPGTAGGAVVMNAGGGGWSFGDRVEELCLIPVGGGRPLVIKGSGVRWGYRTARLDGWVVAWVRLRLERNSPERIRESLRAHIGRKRSTQPLGELSAGCVFRNPPGKVAGRLIEDLGLKGLCRGGASVSERHANFIVNATGSATAEDVKSLLEHVRARVTGTYGVELQTEIVLA